MRSVPTLRLSATMLVLGLTACSVESGVDPVCVDTAGALAEGDAPRLEETWQLATHNAYWVDRGLDDPFASGTAMRFADQVAALGVRSLELDVHRDDDRPHAFRVYHTTPGNSLCDDLADCLAELRAVDAALPDRDPLTLVVELKEITASNFDAMHTIEDLDAIFEAAYGERLFRPRDLLDRCAAANLCPSSLGACAEALGFPTLDELRGKVVVTILGNWDAIGAQAPRDWLDYTLSGDVAERTAFPMASSWQLDWAALSPTSQAMITQDELDRASEQSAAMQVEDTADPRLAPFLARRGLVRIDGANATSDQEARVDLGAQLLQTDTPWVRWGDAGPDAPFAPLGGDTLRKEAGWRLGLDAGDAGARVFAHVGSGGTTARWEALVAAGASDEAAGCLRAAAMLGDAAETSFTVCRTKIASATAGATEDAEQAVVVVRSCDGGMCSEATLSSRDEPSIAGDVIALELEPHGDGVCVRAQAAATADVDLTVAFGDVGDRVCFDVPLPLQGIAREEAAAEARPRVWFFGAARDGAPVEAADLEVSVESATGVLASGSLLVDASVAK